MRIFIVLLGTILLVSGAVAREKVRHDRPCDAAQDHFEKFNFNPECGNAVMTPAHASEKFVIEQISGDESDDSWSVDADFYSGLASCEKAKAKWLQDDQDAGGTQHSWSSLKCVPYSPAKHGRLDVPLDPEKGSLVTEHRVFYVPMVIGGRSGLFMGGFSSKEVHGDRAECLAEAKKRNESQDGFGPDFKPQQEPQRWEVRCYPFSSTITHHRL
jgi:hypothetical protein